ncbi:MAG: hypothetical protein LBQ19_03935 [Synergistaceae bacterium]|jgi:hypothetical protein|nr:hypothetical protein [Synergistaceae bacterium]
MAFAGPKTNQQFITRGAALPLLFKRGIRTGVLPALILLFSFFFTAPAASSAGVQTLRFDEMYDGVSSLGINLSGKLKSLDGQAVAMEGFMAPPLKPTLNFFVLTRVPMSICPFCSTDADWPYDIVMVRLDKPAAALPFDRPIRVEGLLELGSETDRETGFVSLVRIRATRLSEAR